ncbi:rho GTPase-activating protein 20-like isoform X2 [Ambystoma mexicanum]
MKTSVQRRRSTPSAISKALSKSRSHSREITVFPAHPGNGLLIGAFCSPNSTFLLDERAHLTSGLQTQERHLFLFSDALIIAKSKSSSSLKLKKRVRLSEMWIGSCLQEVSEKRTSSEYSFVIGWPTANYIVTFSSPEAKEKWLSTLQWHISERKRDEYPQKVPLNILLLDADEYTSCTMVNVSNTDPAEKVIKMAAQQLSLPGRPSDYHLCVLSGKDDSPFPLLGHEYPFSIILSCLRDFADQRHGTNNNVLPGSGIEPFLLEQLPKDRQCQFILKPRPQAPMHLRKDSTQKHSKRKKSLIDWALRRSGSSPGGSPSSQSPTTRRKLFGLSLSSVCPNGSLPKPIMDMLLLLYREGPSTRGIFRRSANAKTCKELKEKLNSGDEVQMGEESVFVAAAVITDFLRNIPDSVLSSEMYGLWMDATDMQHHEYKIEAIKSLLEKLPEANLILLRHLFKVLHHIEENSEENQMTAFNLALCIAPNMLWLPTPTGPEEESRSTRKVATLVQFLIENSENIFGDDTPLFFKHSDEEESCSSEDLSGIHLIQRQDSSDELEFSASDLERSPHHLRKDDGGLFGASSGSLLDEEREDWDLFNEITACYQNKSRKHNSGESYEKSSFNSMGSECSLNAARDRCSSEPSVCLSSQLPVQAHEPVARQSSCDATIMRSHVDYIQRLKQLQLESQRLIGESLSPGTNRTRRNLWRSPPQTSSKIKQLGLPKKNSSNMSSLSSLSSSTPSPSVSSLSSLDSAFSYCSESSVFSPTDVSSLPFMFGTSARLHTLSPENSNKVLKEWHMTLPFSLESNTGDPDSSSDYDEKEDECSSSMREAEGFSRMNGSTVESQSIGRNLENEGKEKPYLEGSGEEEKGPWDLQEHKQTIDAHCLSATEVSEHIQRGNRQTSVKHIEITNPDIVQPGLDTLKRTKIAFYMAPNILPTRSLEEQDQSDCPVDTGSEPNDNAQGKETKSLQAVEVRIPQTVFYGQNTPLVLHSVSRKHHPQTHSPHWQTQWKHTLKKTITREKTVDNTPPPEVDHVHSPPELPKGHSKSGSSFSHTIRIILPASVRNTVKEYFKHSETKHCCTEVEAVESELIQSTTDWHGTPCTDIPKEALETVVFAEETFV